MRLSLTGRAPGQPISLAVAKSWLRIDQEEEDEQVAGLLEAARQFVETRTRLALGLQTWTLTLEGFPCRGGPIELPRPPLRSVASVGYLDGSGAEVTVDPAGYRAVTGDLERGVVECAGSSWPTAGFGEGALRVVYACGLGPGGPPVPEPLVVAIRLLLAAWYQDREGAAPTPPAAVAICDQYRVPLLA